MGDGDNKMWILVVVVGALAIVAIVVSAVSLSRNGAPMVNINSDGKSPSGQASGGPQTMGGGGGARSGAPPAPAAQQAPIYITPNGGAAGGGMAIDAGGAAFPVGTSGRIYTLAIGHDYGSHEYFDGKGYLTGFGIGIVDLVCEEAGIDCRMVWDRYDNCWDSQAGQHATGGQGLHDRWYDACTGWYTTIERIHVFAYATPYLKEPKTQFYVLTGRSLDTSTSSLQSKKMLFIEGWASDEKCLYRETKTELPVSQIQYVTDEDKAVELLRNGWDALFTTHTTVQEQLAKGTLKAVDKDYSCMIAGNTIMTRKDSDLASQWNRGFNKIRTNGRFKKYCIEANEAHKAKGNVTCVDGF